MKQELRDMINLYFADGIGIRSAMKQLKEMGCTNREINTFLEEVLEIN